jgi:hypothetical protein
MKNFARAFLITELFFVASNSWALGIPGFPALNSAIGLLCAVFVGMVEAWLTFQMFIHIVKANNGQPGEWPKVLILFLSIAVVPFVPGIVSFLYNIFFQAGGSPASTFWNGS